MTRGTKVHSHISKSSSNDDEASAQSSRSSQRKRSESTIVTTAPLCSESVGDSIDRKISSFKDKSNIHSKQKSTNRYTVEMNKYTLRFLDEGLEQVFRAHYNRYVVSKVRIACYMSGALHCLMAALETVFGYTTGATGIMLLGRIMIIGITLVFFSITRTKTFQINFELCITSFYLLRGIVLILLYIIGVEYGTEVAEDTEGKNNVYFFYSGRWSLPSTLMYITICFNLSGMRFKMASAVAWVHLILLIIAGRVVYKGYPGWNDPQIMFAPLLAIFCMSSAYSMEKQVRQDFVHRCNVAEDRKNRDKLLEAMLPVHIKNDLKRDKRDSLDEYFDEVTILFSYISDFSTLSSSASAVELVQFINTIVSAFDKATDKLGVYKVEAIAETYMCAAGVPTKDPNHSEHIAEMALAMMKITEKKQWIFNGKPVKLQIGIHSGPVVAGVIGDKSYSYHLFGDTVNTTSRMCSTSTPGRVHLSERAYQNLCQSNKFKLEKRGEIKVKGKGLMTTYWLNGIIDRETSSIVGQKPMRSWNPNLDEQKKNTVVTTDMDNIGLDPRTLKFVCNNSSPEKKNETSRLIASIEKDYTMDYNSTYLPQFQSVFSKSFFVAIIAIVNETETFGDEPNLDLRISLKVGIVSVLVVVLAASHLMPNFNKHMQLVGSSAAVISLALFNINLYLVPILHLLDVNMIIVTIVSLFLRLRFMATLLVNSFSIGLYTMFLVSAKHQLWWNVIGYVCLTITCFIVSSFSCYKREYGLRLDYLLERTLKIEKEKCEKLLANMLPSPRHAEALMSSQMIVDQLHEVTLLYSDIVGFTSLSAKMKPDVLCALLNRVYTAFDSHIDKYGVYKMDTIGDAFIVIGGLPDYKSENCHALATTAFAMEMLKEIARIRKEEGVDIDMRIGIHSGSVVGGVVGIKRPRYLIWGSNTVIANTMESKGIPRVIQVSSSTKAHLEKFPKIGMSYRDQFNINGNQVDAYVLNENISMDYIKKNLEILSEGSADSSSTEKSVSEVSTDSKRRLMGRRMTESIQKILPMGSPSIMKTPSHPWRKNCALPKIEAASSITPVPRNKSLDKPKLGEN